MNILTSSAVALTVSTVISNFAAADVIKCTFTEPFVKTTYSMVQQSLTSVVAGGSPRVLRHVSFQIRGPGRFDLVDRKGKVLQELTLSFRGSDGMSDLVYPYEVKDLTMASSANNGIGGCTSNYLRSQGDGAAAEPATGAGAAEPVRPLE